MMWVMMIGCCLAVPVALILVAVTAGSVAGLRPWLLGVGAALAVALLVVHRASGRAGVRLGPTAMADLPSAPAVRGDVARRYDRVARYYDAFEAPMDLLGGRGRRGRTVGGAAAAPSRSALEPAHAATSTSIRRRSTSPPSTSRPACWLAPNAGLSGLTGPSVWRWPTSNGSPSPTPRSTPCAPPACSARYPTPSHGLREVARSSARADRFACSNTSDHATARSAGSPTGSALSPNPHRAAINRRTEANAIAAGVDLVDVRRRGVWREIRATAASPTAAARFAQPIIATVQPGARRMTTHERVVRERAGIAMWFAIVASAVVLVVLFAIGWGVPGALRSRTSCALVHRGVCLGRRAGADNRSRHPRRNSPPRRGPTGR